MKRLAVALGMLAMALPLMAVAQTSTWVPDKAHSEVDFSILHMSLSKVHGRFGNLGGQIVWNEADITKSTVNMTIDVTTVDTGVGPRDNDLKSSRARLTWQPSPPRPSRARVWQRPATASR